MKTSQKWHVTVCFETCIVVTRNIQWEVTLACSALQAPYTVRINPLDPEITGRSGNRGKQIDQRDSVLETTHVSFDHYYCAEVHIFLSCMFRDFSPIVLVHSMRFEFIPNLPEMLRWPEELNAQQLKATACKYTKQEQMKEAPSPI